MHAAAAPAGDLLLKLGLGIAHTRGRGVERLGERPQHRSRGGLRTRAQPACTDDRLRQRGLHVVTPRQLPRVGGVARGRGIQHRGRQPARIRHHGAGVTRHHALAHEREVALGAVGVPGEQLDGHDLPEHRIAEELEPLIRPEVVGCPLRMHERLAPEADVERLEQLGEVTGWVSGFPRNRSGR